MPDGSDISRLFTNPLRQSSRAPTATHSKGAFTRSNVLSPMVASANKNKSSAFQNPLTTGADTQAVQAQWALGHGPLAPAGNPDPLNQDADTRLKRPRPSSASPQGPSDLNTTEAIPLNPDPHQTTGPRASDLASHVQPSSLPGGRAAAPDDAAPKSHTPSRRVDLHERSSRRSAAQRDAAAGHSSPLKPSQSVSPENPAARDAKLERTRRQQTADDHTLTQRPLPLLPKPQTPPGHGATATQAHPPVSPTRPPRETTATPLFKSLPLDAMIARAVSKHTPTGQIKHTKPAKESSKPDQPFLSDRRPAAAQDQASSPQTPPTAGRSQPPDQPKPPPKAAREKPASPGVVLPHQPIPQDQTSRMATSTPTHAPPTSAPAPPNPKPQPVPPEAVSIHIGRVEIMAQSKPKAVAGPRIRPRSHRIDPGLGLRLGRW